MQNTFDYDIIMDKLNTLYEVCRNMLYKAAENALFMFHMTVSGRNFEDIR